MLTLSPIVCDGIEYKYITAYIYRLVKSRGTYKTVLQCELLDKSETSVTIANAKNVELARRVKK